MHKVIKMKATYSFVVEFVAVLDSLTGNTCNIPFTLHLHNTICMKPKDETITVIGMRIVKYKITTKFAFPVSTPI